MKIMYVDTGINGHHPLYLNCLLRAASEDSFAVLPESTDRVWGRIRTAGSGSVREASEYGRWMKELRQIAEKEKPDIIHFLDGDSIMRHFGRGLARLGAFGTVITFHHLFQGKLREISLKRMLHHADAGVVHTESMLRRIKGFGCGNVSCVPYPCFLDALPGAGEAYQNEPPVLLALGGTRYDKGLDILLNALKRIDIPFQLIIAGRTEDFDEAFIRKRTETYRDRVELYLRFLKEEEVKEFLERADMVVLPYRKSFEGASGPMCEGIYLGKTIVGPAHGSLGETIRKTHTGYTFESEDEKNLSECIEYALKHPCIYDETALLAQRSLRPELFAKKYMEIYQAIVH